MGKSTAKIATYTHVGCRAAVGYQHTGKDYAHYEKQGGRRHALNASGYRCYVSLCGETVHEDSNDHHDQGGKNPIWTASEGTVTCKRCLARKPVVADPKVETLYRVMYTTPGCPEPSCWTSGKRRFDASAEQWSEFLRTKRDADRVWEDSITVTTTY